MQPAELHALDCGKGSSTTWIARSTSRRRISTIAMLGLSLIEMPLLLRLKPRSAARSKGAKTLRRRQKNSPSHPCRTFSPGRAHVRRWPQASQPPHGSSGLLAWARRPPQSLWKTGSPASLPEVDPLLEGTVAALVARIAPLKLRSRATAAALARPAKFQENLQRLTHSTRHG